LPAIEILISTQPSSLRKIQNIIVQPRTKANSSSIWHNVAFRPFYKAATMSTPMTTQQFKLAMSQFATGITVMSALDNNNKPVGMTANSFNSVSLHPPLVLWSLAKSSSHFNTFAQCMHYGVSILSASQEAISQRFSIFKGDRFDGVEVSLGKTGLPFIAHSLAHFECKTRSVYDEGDHVILVGEVIDCQAAPSAALVYHARQYHALGKSGF
jgi:flavin reductase (DIM6/NTAB) family NADH-FMN oxidoreductase RutF